MAPRGPASLPVVIETVRSRDHPLAGDEHAPADVPTADLQAGLPGPLPLAGLQPAHNSTGELTQATV